MAIHSGIFSRLAAAHRAAQSRTRCTHAAVYMSTYMCTNVHIYIQHKHTHSYVSPMKAGVTSFSHIPNTLPYTAVDTVGAQYLLNE